MSLLTEETRRTGADIETLAQVLAESEGHSWGMMDDEGIPGAAEWLGRDFFRNLARTAYAAAERGAAPGLKIVEDGEVVVKRRDYLYAIGWMPSSDECYPGLPERIRDERTRLVT